MNGSPESDFNKCVYVYIASSLLIYIFFNAWPIFVILIFEERKTSKNKKYTENKHKMEMSDFSVETITITFNDR